MLVGLFRLLTDSSFRIWSWTPPLETGRVDMFPICRALKPLTLFSILKGIIWLLIATVAGVPPTASSTSFLVYLLSHRYMNEPGIHFFESERYCYSLFPVSMRDTELNAILRISSVQPRTFSCITSWGRH
jgi:hypothetical protein